MKRKLLISLSAMLALGIVLSYNLNNAHSFTGGPPTGKTGSPGDGGATCTGCHAGTAVAQSGLITTNVPAAGYTPGETYTITVSGASSGISKWGFQACVENASGVKVGALILTDATNTALSGNYVAHTSAGTTGSNAISWSFDWTAPCGETDITFYTAMNLTNGASDSSGDVINTSSLTIALDAMSAITTATDPTCLGDCDAIGAVVVSGGLSGYNYLWNDGQSTIAANGLCSGTYDVTISDACGVELIETVVVSDPTALVVSFTTNSAACGQSTGDATAASNGPAPYTYQWGNFQTSATATGLASGSYDATVTDGSGCPAIGTANVSDAGAPTASITSTTDNLCSGNCNGEADVDATGGTTPYVYAWSNAQLGGTATGLCAGVYSVTVSDDLGCNTILSASILEPSAVAVTLTATEDSIVQCDVQLEASAAGGSGTFTYLWSNGIAAASVDSLCSGTYTLTITDANGCESIESVDVSDVFVDGISEANQMADFTMYPNPSNEMLLISGNGIASIALVNQLGQSVMEKNNVNLNLGVQLNLIGLSRGIYQLRVNNLISLQSKTLIVR